MTAHVKLVVKVATSSGSRDSTNSSLPDNARDSKVLRSKIWPPRYLYLPFWHGCIAPACASLSYRTRQILILSSTEIRRYRNEGPQIVTSSAIAVKRTPRQPHLCSSLDHDIPSDNTAALPFCCMCAYRSRSVEPKVIGLLLRNLKVSISSQPWHCRRG